MDDILYFLPFTIIVIIVLKYSNKSSVCHIIFIKV